MADMKLFGFTIKRAAESNTAVQMLPTFAPRPTDETVTTLTSAIGGAYGVFLDLEGNTKDETDTIMRYRDMSLTPECSKALQFIVTECICYDEQNKVVSLVLDNIDDTVLPPTVKAIIIKEFEYLLNLMDFNKFASEYFTKWYVDGRLYMHAIIDPQNTLAGIQELRPIDTLKLKKIREVYTIPATDPAMISQGKKTVENTNEYYIYSESGFAKNKVQGLKIARDSIVFATSGLTDRYNRHVLSYLHKAIRPFNQLRYMEDAAIIYRIVRAPERRIFTVDVGDMPKPKADEYMRSVMSTNKSKLIYDSSTGEIRDDRKHQTILEDYYLPTRGGERGIKIDTLPSGDNLGEMRDVEYFQEKLYEALDVPLSRLKPDSLSSFGSSAQITNEEVVFHRLVNTLRMRFSTIFTTALERQLILKNICTEQDWRSFKNNIRYKYHDDSHFDHLLEMQNLSLKLQTLNQILPFIGTFFSKDYVDTKILNLDNALIEEINKQIQQDLANGEPISTSNVIKMQAETAQSEAQIAMVPSDPTVESDKQREFQAQENDKNREHQSKLKKK